MDCTNYFWLLLVLSYYTLIAKFLCVEIRLEL